MKDILEKVNNYVSKIGNIKIERVLYSKKDKMYMFFFEKNPKDEDDYQECILAKSDTKEIIIKNLLTLMIEEQEHKYSDDYEDITIAD